LDTIFLHDFRMSKIFFFVKKKLLYLNPKRLTRGQEV
jgi:hypothetical protein